MWLMVQAATLVEGCYTLLSPHTLNPRRTLPSWSVSPSGFAFEEGSYLRLIDFEEGSYLRLIDLKKKKDIGASPYPAFVVSPPGFRLRV